MYNTIIQWLENPVVQHIRRMIVGVLLVVSILIGGLALKYETREALAASAETQWPDRQFSRLWVDSDGTITGARVEYNRIVFERKERNASSWQRVEVAVKMAGESADDALWTADGSATRFAWVDARGIHATTLDFNRKTVDAQATIRLPNVRSLNFISKNQVETVLKNYTVQIWDMDKQEVTPEPRYAMDRVEQVVGDGDYLAVASAATRKMMLYRTVEGVPRVIDQAEVPPDAFRLVMPAPGQMAAIWSGGIWTRGKRINTPGPVERLVAGPNNALVVAGSFQGIHHCEPTECREISDQSSVTAMAASDKFLVASGPGGTARYTFFYESIYTTKGQIQITAAGIAFAIFALLASVSMVLKVIKMILSQEKAGIKGVPERFALTNALVDAFKNGRVILWAGSGLSAQAGLPTRKVFVRSLIENAMTESWVDSKYAAKLLAEWERGYGEECIPALADYLGADRVHLDPFFKMMYRRFTLMSPAFVALARLPIKGAISTNYDATLDRMGPRWTAGVVPMPYNPLSALKSDQFFVWKIYGDATEGPLVLCRPDLKTALENLPTLPDVVDRIFRARTVFFVGASLEGLIEDLTLLGVKPYPNVRHFAFAATTSSKWHKQAAVLKMQFGVEVQVCDDRTIHTALPEFLAKLATAVAGESTRSESFVQAAGD